ncbi:MAG: hypothetical protein EXS14_02980 [Planctomycetes bacterium]|nr:hypothetical protein [Planctomycetota bacterium]
MKTLSLCLLLCCVMAAQETPFVKGGMECTALRRLPVLEGERYKPLDSLAQEWVERITGKRRFQDTEPMLMFLHWRFEGAEARKERVIQLTDGELSKELGLDINSMAGSYRSFDELAENTKFKNLVDSARNVADKDHTHVQTEALRLDSRFSMFGSIAGIHEGWEQSVELGGWLPCVPPPEAPKAGTKYRWISPAQMRAAGVDPRRAEAFGGALGAVKTAFLARDSVALESASSTLLQAATALGYPQGAMGFSGTDAMDREIRLNQRRPFESAVWWFFCAFLLSLVPLVAPRARSLLFLAAAPAAYAIYLMAFGMFERTALSGRAMIGTFYESMLYVSAAAGLLGVLFELWARRGWFLCTGSLVAFAGLFVATHNPDFMQPAISTLRPVLINNDWIHIHVPTIMTSYAMLGLAFTLGQVWLVRYLFVGESTDSQKHLAKAAWIAIPVGQVLLFAGIVLGGVWADASWGRFWGWDPKEVGALIMWLVFMVVVHGRFAGWLKDFGTSLGSMVGGWSLLWSYYGTNFFQSGQHSYAAANGSKVIPLWLWVFTVAQLSLLAAAVLKHRAQANSAKAA